MNPNPRLHHLQLFRQLVWHRDHSGRRMSVTQAWRVAGIASGQMKAIPEDLLSWWWKIQELRCDDEEGDLKTKAEQSQPPHDAL